MRKKLLRCLLAIVMLLGLCVTTYAKSPIQPLWDELDAIGGNIDISSSGKATVYGLASSAQADSMKIKISLRQDGREIKSWTASSNSFMVSKEATYNVSRGHDYDIVVTAYVYVGGTLVDTGDSTFDYGYF